MAVTVSMPLFGNPERELEHRVRPRELRDLADSLRERLLAAADRLDRLLADGWKAEVGSFDLILTHPRVHTTEQATARLRKLEIDPEQMLIFEEIEDEE